MIGIGILNATQALLVLAPGAGIPAWLNRFKTRLWALIAPVSIALVVASALLALHHLRKGDVHLSAGFLVFLAGETLIVSGSAMDVAASAPSFAAGTGLWSAALALVSASTNIPTLVRVTGSIAAILFAVTAAAIFGGTALTPLSGPLPFYAYPFLAVTLLGWAWAHRPSSAPAEVGAPAGARANG